MKPIIVIIFLSFCFYTFCDDGSGYENFTIGQVEYNYNKNIQMLNEKVYVTSDEVSTLFTFKNTIDKSVKVTFLFPITGNYIENSFIMKDEEKSIEEKIEENFFFLTYINGVETKRKLVKAKESEVNIDYNWAFVTDYVFKPKEEIKIWNYYKNRNKKAFSSSDGSGNYTQEYVLKTGGTWKGKINEITIYWDSTNYTTLLSDKYYSISLYSEQSSIIARIYLRSYKWSVPWQKIESFEGKKWFVWNYKNIKPDFNITYESSSELISADSNINEIINDKRYYDTISHAEIFLTNMDNMFRGTTSIDNHFLDLINFCINLKYALSGYEFNSDYLKNYFQSFDWYKPKKDFKINFEFEKDIYPFLYYKSIVKPK